MIIQTIFVNGMKSVLKDETRSVILFNIIRGRSIHSLVFILACACLKNSVKYRKCKAQILLPYPETL